MSGSLMSVMLAPLSVQSYVFPAMIIISHQERILNIADEIAVLADGAIVRYGARADIFPDLIGTESAQGTCNRLRRDV